MIRRLPVAIAVTVLLGGCSSQLGRDVPECDRPVTNAGVMQIQAVTSASLVPCVNTLEAGWTFNHVEPRSGLAEFTVDSDRIGEPFLTVRTTAACDIGDAEQSTSDEPGTELFRDVLADFTVDVVVIPEGPSDETTAAARSIVVELFDATMNDRNVDARIDDSTDPTSERIDAAANDGAHVIVVSIRDAEEGTVSLRLAGQSEEATGSVRQALEAIESTVRPPAYRGSWFYVFEGGCTEYRFDGAGPGIETIAGDVQASFSFTDTEMVKEIARSAGFDIP